MIKTFKYWNYRLLPEWFPGLKKSDTMKKLQAKKFKNIQVQKMHGAYACWNLAKVQNLCRVSLRSYRIKLVIKRFVSKLWLQAAAYGSRLGN